MENNRLIETFQRLTEPQQEFLLRVMILLEGTDSFPPQPPKIDDEEMTRLDVIAYLGISPRTYIRRVKDGTLKPRELPGGDRFYKRDLKEARKESIRRGRI